MNNIEPSKPRAVSIKDMNRLKPQLSEVKKINPKDLSKAIRTDHGIEPEKQPKVYDSYVDSIIQTVGMDMADEMFEKAKDIIYRRAIEIQVDNDVNVQIKEHTTKIDEEVIDMNIPINKVPGPKRKK